MEENQDRAVPQNLLESLNSPDREEALEAVWEIGKLKTKASLELLANIFADKNEDVGKRCYAIICVAGGSPDNAGLELIKEALKESDPLIRKTAISALQYCGPAALELLFFYLKSDYPAERISAAAALSEIKDSRAMEPLLAALKDPNSSVRIHAVQALGKLRDSKVVEPLLKMLDDDELQVRYRVIQALSHFDHARIIPVLKQIVKEDDKTIVKYGETLKDMALDSLGKISKRNSTVNPNPEKVVNE